ncbi:hypothetical protein COO60DRAFT_870256 [Scenedesmus sp. NREL 46B-D3]|nr:hypothetical protein COO60DRAFT_870256 [Scenedesmus sp. NREL 46B-D3]
MRAQCQHAFAMILHKPCRCACTCHIHSDNDKATAPAFRAQVGTTCTLPCAGGTQPVLPALTRTSQAFTSAPAETPFPGGAATHARRAANAFRQQPWWSPHRQWLQQHMAPQLHLRHLPAQCWRWLRLRNTGAASSSATCSSSQRQTSDSWPQAPPHHHSAPCQLHLRLPLLPLPLLLPLQRPCSCRCSIESAAASLWAFWVATPCVASASGVRAAGAPAAGWPFAAPR